MASRAGPPSSAGGAEGAGSSLGSSSSSFHNATVATRPTAKSTSDPVLRNALRYTISAREYALLHKYVISRSRLLKKRAPSVDTVQRIMDGVPPRRTRAVSQASKADSRDKDKGKGKAKAKGDRMQRAGGALEVDTQEDTQSAAVGADDYNARAVRHSLRVLFATGALMKLWDVVSTRLLAGKKQDVTPAAGQKKWLLHRSPAVRLSLSLSAILLLYRLLFRFFTRLRLHILDPSAAPFRMRNPRTAGALTSPYAPAVGASLAGLALGMYPARQLRVSIAIYALFRALEFGWNCGEDNGMIWGWERGANGRPNRKRARPWWWGSWMLQPFAFGQLLHAVVFDRDCFPMAYGDFIFQNSTAYLHPRPDGYPAHLQWPKPYEIVDSLAEMARLRWPPFVSPMLFPNKENTLPPEVSVVKPLTSGAHPLITSLSCATLHPSDPSCTRTLLTFWLRSFPPLLRISLLVYSAMLLPRFRSLYHYPVSTLQRLLVRALSMSSFLTGSISTAWASLCFFQAWLPRSVLATQRFFLGGFVAGLWAWIERRHGRATFLYSARVSLDSLWKVGVKRRWWRAMKGGDVWIFVLALALTGAVYERDARAVREANWRKGISWVRGEGWRDWGVEPEEAEEAEEAEGYREGEAGADDAEADARPHIH